jgi:hypothetical protein
MKTTSRLSKHFLKKYFTVFSSLALFLHPLTANAQTGTFSDTGSMTTARYQHTVTLVGNGKVLVAGGTANYSFDALASGDL